MKNYELSYLITPELKIEEAEGIAFGIKDIIQGQGGLISKAEGPNPKTLGYKIKGQMSALQVNLEFSLEPNELNAVEEGIKKNPNVLRYLITNKKTFKEKLKRGKMAETTSGMEKSALGNIFTSAEAPADRPADKEKIELKDIDEKLEEILKE